MRYLPIDGVFVPLVDVGHAGGGRGAHDVVLGTGVVVGGVGIVHRCHTATTTTTVRTIGTNGLLYM